MALGKAYEPKVREILEEKLGVKIKEVGLAVWKRNPIFGCSLDGEFEEDGEKIGIEIKCPEKMYKPVVDKLNNDYKYPVNDKKKYIPDCDSFIYKSHLYQMIANGMITRKDKMIYCV